SPGRPRIPRCITAGEVQALAVANTPLGTILDPTTLPKAAHPLLDPFGTTRARRDLLTRARELAAEELRNQNAGTALELFWKLTANLEKCRLLGLGRAEVHAQQALLEEAIAKNLKAARDRNDILLKASKLASDEVAVRIGLEQLQDQLGLL